VFQGPGEITVPILLYHHIGISEKGSPYYVSVEEFEKHMALLDAWGYKTISVELLVKAIQQGAELPNRPIILTFDDGSETVHTQALPIMQQYGFTGTAYIVYNWIGAGLYMDRKQILALRYAGWEIGSHSISHINLRQRPGKQEDEIVSSRRRLQEYLGIPIMSFAYPFGANDPSSLTFVREAGYLAAMGLGTSVHQSEENLFYLYRREIQSDDDIYTFSQFLPWEQP
jgi:peptidoglycan/xylan/chitin deacetylase (PgdA/CDA1 family)